MVSVNLTEVAGDWSVIFEGAGTTPDVTRAANADGVFTAPPGTYSSIKFTISDTRGFEMLRVDSIIANVTCFCAGTRIKTPTGWKEVQDIVPGDVLKTAEGGKTVVRWLGLRAIDMRISDPLRVNPICITAGALGEALPKRDLWLSQDHAIAISGALYNAGTLVNGSTIYQVQEMPREGFTYYHVETEAHELLVAEGVPSETYIDYLADGPFDNAPFDNATDRPHRIIAEMALPRVASARLVPARLRIALSPPVAA